MTIAQTNASKARWIKYDKKERSRRMSLVASAKWAKKTIEEKRAHAMMMVKCRKIIS